MKHISSTQNTIVKELISLQSKAKTRKEKLQFVVEGKRELLLAHLGQYQIQTIFWCAEIFDESQFTLWQKQFEQDVEIISVSLAVYQKLVVRNSTEGVVGIVRQKSNSLESWQPKRKHPLLLMLESIEKPGNLGAILRTAEAGAIDAVIITEQHTDLHNPNVIRSSVGGFFSVPVFVCSNEEANTFLAKNNIHIYAASLQKSIDYTKADYTKPTAFVLGSEAKGLSPFWYQKNITPVKIPMLGHVDSLNVSVATAILSYEALRQRNS